MQMAARRLENRYLAGVLQAPRGVAIAPARLLKLNGAWWCNASCVAWPACQLSARAREPCLHCACFILRAPTIAYRKRSVIEHDATAEPQRPRQRCYRHRPFLVAFLSAVPAADVSGVAVELRCVVHRARSLHCPDVVRCRIAADTGWLSGGPLWRPAFPYLRDPPDGVVDLRPGVCHGLLAGLVSLPAVRGRQFGDPPDRLRNSQRLGAAQSDGPLICAPHQLRQH
jgi:hypothetical protein